MKPTLLSTLIVGLLLLPLVAAPPASAQSHSSRDWCSGLRVPTDLKEAEARCVMLKAASAYLEERGLRRPSDREFERALRAAGIDPAQKASCWGLPWDTLGAVFSAPSHLTQYRSELGCQRVTPRLQLNPVRHDTRWQVDERGNCQVRISSDFDTFISVEIDAGRAEVSVAIFTGTDGVTPQTVVVDDEIFVSRAPEYAIGGQDAEDGLRAMLRGRFVKNVSYDRTVRLGNFPETLRREVRQMGGCPGAPTRLLD